MTFFVVSVVSTAVTLLGAALLYAATGAVHFAGAGRPRWPAVRRTAPLTTVAVVLVLAGLAFKVAAVPLHAWAPATYDGAPLPVAAYLSTASKLGGVVAILLVTAAGASGRRWTVAGPMLAVLAALTMTVGNLGRAAPAPDGAAAGLVVGGAGRLHPGAAGRAGAGGRAYPDGGPDGVAAATRRTRSSIVVLELAAFGAVVALRGPGATAARSRRLPGRGPAPPGWPARSCWRWSGWPGCRRGWPACSPR